jgi:hypothetical protein
MIVTKEAGGKDDNRCRSPRVAAVVESPTFVSLSVHGIDDDERRTGVEAAVYAPGHLGVCLVAHVIVGSDVKCEPLVRSTRSESTIPSS